MKRFKTLVFLFFAVFGDLASAEEDERIKSCRLSLRSKISMEWLPKKAKLDDQLKNSARAPLSAYLFVEYIREYFGEAKLNSNYIQNVMTNESLLKHGHSLFRLGELIEAELIDAGLQDIAKLSYQGLKQRPEIEAQQHDSKMLFETFNLRSEFSEEQLKNSQPHIVSFDRFGQDGTFELSSFFILHWDPKKKLFIATDPLEPKIQFEVKTYSSKKSNLPRVIKKNNPSFFQFSGKDAMKENYDSAYFIPMASIGLL